MTQERIDSAGLKQTASIEPGPPCTLSICLNRLVRPSDTWDIVEISQHTWKVRKADPAQRQAVQSLRIAYNALLDVLEASEQSKPPQILSAYKCDGDWGD